MVKSYSIDIFRNMEDEEGDRGVDANVAILDAVERAKALGLCLRRIWALAASLPDREKSLPKLIPAADVLSIPAHNTQHQQHEQCTFDFCEHSRIDFTFVEQRHEQGHENTMHYQDCHCLEFPLGLVRDRVKQGEPAVWKLHDRSLLDSSHPYMAISHVWADGTGTGVWGPGKVHECLYEFFCDIANEFQCEGCWWDTISIPSDDEARAKALANMHNNYAEARITLVHDLFLRSCAWVNAETACFAIVMSPWYSRGWTALELSKSHKVKILFKARNGRHVIKDLDVDILQKVPQNEMAQSIQKLRGAGIQTMSNLLAVLGPRDTSKPRDMPIISGLLVGVDVHGGLSQQEIYQRILRKFGRVNQEHMFHNSATMSTPGFSWCPTNIFDMPVGDGDSGILKVQENGDVEGTWRVYETNSVTHEDLNWKGTHLLMKVFLESALQSGSKEKHIFLVENGRPRSRALLVKPMDNGVGKNVVCCSFIGPVYFRTALGAPNCDKSHRTAEVRIGSTEGMKEYPGNAWDNLPPAEESHHRSSSTQDTKLTEYERSGFDPQSDPHSEPLYVTHNNGTVILYLGEGITEWQFHEPLKPESLPSSLLTFLSKIAAWRRIFLTESPLKTAKLPELSIGESSMMVLPVPYQSTTTASSPSTKALFYGKKGLVPSVNNWLRGFGHEYLSKFHRPLLLLSIKENGIITIDENEDRRNELAGNALTLVVQEGEGGYVAPLVTLLLNHCAKHECSVTGTTPLHMAVEKKRAEMVQVLLNNKINPASADAVDKGNQTAIHLAAAIPLDSEPPLSDIPAKALKDSAELLVSKSNRFITQKNLDGMTALRIAARTGNHIMVELLLKRIKNITAQDSHRDATPQATDDAIDGEHEESHLESRPRHESSRGEQPMTFHYTAAMVERTNENQTPLSETAQMGMDIKAEADIEMSMALRLAVEKRHASVFRVLAEFGAKVHGPEEGAASVLTLADTGEIIDQILRFYKECFGKEELDKALLEAAKRNRRDVVKRLREAGAESGIPDSDGMTALHWTIRNEDDENARGFIHENAPLDLKGGPKQQTPLLLALEKRMKHTVIALLDNRASVSLCDSSEQTALHWAASTGDMTAIEILVETEDSTLLDRKDCLGRTALHWAAYYGFTEAIDAIVNAKAGCSIRDKCKKTALIIATERRKAKAVEKLLSGGSFPTAEDENGMTALDRAATVGDETMVLSIAEAIEKEASQTDDAKIKALQLAANGGHLSVAIALHERIGDLKRKRLAMTTVMFSAATTDEDSSKYEDIIQNVEDINATHGEHSQTALILSVRRQNQPLISVLLKHGADVNMKDKNGVTALMMAVRENQFRVIQDLLGHGANSRIQDNNGYTALHYAAEGCQEHILAYMLEENRDLVAVEDFNGCTALHYAVQSSKSQFKSSYWWGSSHLIHNMGTSRDTHLRIPTNISVLFHYGAKLRTKNKQGQTPLHLAVVLSEDVALALLVLAGRSKQLVPEDMSDAEGRSPLMLAAERGYLRVVSKLGENNPNATDKNSKTALSLAAERGHQDVVAELLSHEADPNIPDSQGHTALSLAARNGHMDIVDKLLKCGADANIADQSGRKAWQKALEKGHASILGKLLPERRESIRDSHEINQALQLASRKGQVELVRVLLDEKADTAFQNGRGWTALHMAAMNGHRDVVDELLAKGKVLVIEDKEGQSALLQATERGFKSIVERLLNKSEIKKDIKRWKGLDALLLAAERGYKDIFELLVKEDVDLNLPDSTGKTALSLAAMNGHSEIVKLLLNSKANVAVKDKHGRTALHHAARGGHDDAVKSLLQGSTAPSALDKWGQSALHLAAERGANKVIQHLLDHKAEPNAKSADGQTALHRAAWGGSDEAVQQLLGNGADANIRDKVNIKPWQIAAEKGHESIVEVLLGDTVLCDERISNKQALLAAAQMGYEGIAKSLLDRGMRTTVEDEDGLTPLHWAMKQGNAALVVLISSQVKVVIDALDNQGQTPLCHGVLGGHIEAVKKLLEKNADMDISDKENQTPLHYAARNGNREMVEALVKHEADPHARNASGKKAWELAAEKGYHGIVGYLLEKEVNFRPTSQSARELFLEVASRGQTAMVHILLDKGVEINTQDRLGRTAIGLAAEFQKMEVLDLLLLKGANPCLADLRRQTPLLWAAKSGNIRMANSLLDRNSTILSRSTAANGSTKTEPVDYFSSINHFDCERRTPLLVAIKGGFDDVAQMFLKKGQPKLDVNVQDIAGETALHVAAERGKQDLVQMLLDEGAKPTLKDKWGQTAILRAAKQGNDEVVDILLKHRSGLASSRMEDSQGQTALLLAVRKGDAKMVQKLLDGKKHAFGAAYADDSEDSEDAGGAYFADNTEVMGSRHKALLTAAKNGHTHIVDLLFEKKLYSQGSEKTDNVLFEALSLAAANGDAAAVKTLFKYTKARWSAVSSNGARLSSLAKASGSKEVYWLVGQRIDEAC